MELLGSELRLVLSRISSPSSEKNDALGGCGVCYPADC